MAPTLPGAAAGSGAAASSLDPIHASAAEVQFSVGNEQDQPGAQIWTTTEQVEEEEDDWDDFAEHSPAPVTTDVPTTPGALDLSAAAAADAPDAEVSLAPLDLSDATAADAPVVEVSPAADALDLSVAAVEDAVVSMALSSAAEPAVDEDDWDDFASSPVPLPAAASEQAVVAEPGAAEDKTAVLESEEVVDAEVDSVILPEEDIASAIVAEQPQEDEWDDFEGPGGDTVVEPAAPSDEQVEVIPSLDQPSAVSAEADEEEDDWAAFEGPSTAAAAPAMEETAPPTAQSDFAATFDSTPPATAAAGEGAEEADWDAFESHQRSSGEGAFEANFDTSFDSATVAANQAGSAHSFAAFDTSAAADSAHVDGGFAAFSNAPSHAKEQEQQVPVTAAHSAPNSSFYSAATLQQLQVTAASQSTCFLQKVPSVLLSEVRLPHIIVTKPMNPDFLYV